MLNADQVQEQLDGIKYLPGWRFRAYQGRYEGMHVTIRANVPDAYNPGQTVTLDIHCHLSPNDHENRDSLDVWLAYRLCRIATHEAREFLQRGGRPIFDPHSRIGEHDL